MYGTYKNEFIFPFKSKQLFAKYRLCYFQLAWTYVLTFIIINQRRSFPLRCTVKFITLCVNVIKKSRYFQQPKEK